MPFHLNSVCVCVCVVLYIHQALEFMIFVLSVVQAASVAQLVEHLPSKQCVVVRISYEQLFFSFSLEKEMFRFSCMPLLCLCRNSFHGIY